MLASRKQEWVIEEEQEKIAPSSAAQSPRKNVSLRAKCFLMVALVAITAMFVTIRSETIIRAGYQLVQTKAQVAKMEKENEALRLEIAKLKSPQRIQNIATSQLGMVVPQNIFCATNQNSTPAVDSSVSNDKSVVAKIFDAIKSGKAEASKGR